MRASPLPPGEGGPKGRVRVDALRKACRAREDRSRRAQGAAPGARRVGRHVGRAKTEAGPSPKRDDPRPPPRGRPLPALRANTVRHEILWFPATNAKRSFALERANAIVTSTPKPGRFRLGPSRIKVSISSPLPAGEGTSDFAYFPDVSVRGKSCAEQYCGRGDGSSGRDQREKAIRNRRPNPIPRADFQL